MLSDFLNNLWPNLPVIAGVLAPFLTASSLSVAGLVPSFGPGRALWIILRSRFRPNTTPLSLRHSELATLGCLLKQKTWGQNYLVVTGEKGVGKSRMISTALNKRASVITVQTLPTDNAHTVLRKSLNALTSLKINLIDPTRNANRVIFFHRIFTCGRTPIVVINTAERRVGEPALSLTGVVRALVDDYGLRVVIDSSPNSVDETLLRTNREIVVDVQPMNKETIWSLPQLQDLFQLTKENDLDEVTWAVLGGNPSKYEQLYKQYQVNIGSKEGKEKGELLGQLLCQVVYAATKIVLACSNDADKIIRLFDPHVGYIPTKLVKSEGLIRPSPDKVFREVEISGKTVLIPASNAINIVLRYNMSEKPTLEELKEAAGVVNDVTLKLPIDMDSDEEEKRENGMSKKKQKQKMLTD